MVQNCSWIQNFHRKRSVDISTRSFKRIEKIAGSDASNRRVFGGLCKRDWTASKVSQSYFSLLYCEFTIQGVQYLSE